ncbi:MAG: tetratricopeptide repeat protein, partial [Desulfobacterales bacterium]|nr:tetratricopeptide repeat protein [Desulfobacterales bacterium]
ERHLWADSYNRALRVISRTSAVRYKETDKSLPEIARELNVDAVVEGSVLRVGDRVKITAQLMGTRPERHLWADSYNRDLRDVLALHSEVARAIADEIKVAVTPEEEARLTSARPVDPKAHELYLMGWFFLKKNTQEAVEKGIGYFQQALEEDPDYALAYSGLASAYNLIGNYALSPPRETSPKAKTLALKALGIDETLAEAHTELGYVKMNYDWDWAGAERAYKRAVELNPGYWFAHILYAWYSAALGRFDEALVKMKLALKLDPLSIAINSVFGWHLYMARRYDKAIVQLRKTIEMDPTSYFSYYSLGMVYEQKRMYKEAIEEFQKAIALSDSMTTIIAALGHAYAASDKRGEAQRVISKLQKLSKQKYVSSYDMAVIYTGLGERDQAFQWLEKAYEQRDGWLAGWLKIDPRFDPLHNDPRFADLLRRMNFPE